MGDDARRLTTEQERKRLHTARNRGGRCAGCGRTLGDVEPVYIEQVMIGTRQLAGSRNWPFPVYVLAPFGAECASPQFVQERVGEAPEQCAGCGRGVYYRAARANRHRALCSRRCVHRANQRRRVARAREG